MVIVDQILQQPQHVWQILWEWNWVTWPCCIHRGKSQQKIDYHHAQALQTLVTYYESMIFLTLLGGSIKPTNWCTRTHMLPQLCLSDLIHSWNSGEWRLMLLRNLCIIRVSMLGGKTRKKSSITRIAQLKR